jgi:hypothetical protein
MKEKELTIIDLYDFTRALINNNTHHIVSVSGETLNRLDTAVDLAMKQGAAIYFAEPHLYIKEKKKFGRHLLVAGFTLIEKEGIEGVKCTGNPSFKFNNMDVPFEDYLALMR